MQILLCKYEENNRDVPYQLWCLYHNCTIHPKNARYLLHCNSVTTYPKDSVNYLLHCNSVTTYPKDNVTTCPNVISLTKVLIVDKYDVPKI